MSAIAPQGPEGSGKRRRRLAAMTVMAAVGATTMTATPAAAQQPIGVGPLPITFNLTDENGGWFDSGLDLFGNQSSGVLTSAVWGDGLVDVAAGQTIAKGVTVPYISFAELLA